MSKPPNYPLRFQPILKERMWGGRRLETVLGRRLPSGGSIGESWEISAHAADQSVVVNGAHRGTTLGELVAQFPGDLFPTCQAPALPDARQPPAGEFPLLVKWIDAAEKLSVQVHPPDGHPRLPPGERGKTECWLVLDANPGAEIHLGLRRGIDRPTLERELARGTADRCLNVFSPRPGDFFFVPAGTVHAIGGGVLLAEIQQSSDTTFRLFDWNRTDPTTGRPRELHIDAALDCIDFARPTPAPAHVKLDSGQPSTTMLLGPAECRHFNLAHRSVTTPVPLGSADRFHVVVCLGGAGAVADGGEAVSVEQGACLLLPVAGPFECRPQPQLDLLDAWVP